MPRNLTLLATLLLAVLAGKSQTSRIDQLHTSKQIAHFIRHMHGMGGFSFTPIQPVDTNKERILFEKADFDGNGYTDLLVNGYSRYGHVSSYTSFVILSFPKDSFVLADIGPYAPYEFIDAKMIRTQDGPRLHVVAIAQLMDSTGKSKVERWSDTLMYAYGHFVERVDGQPIPLSTVTHLRFSVCCGYTYAGDFDLTLDLPKATTIRMDKNADRPPHLSTAVDSGGSFTAKIDPAKSDTIAGLLNLLADEKGNKHDIWGHVPDAPQVEFELTYADGRIKKIDASSGIPPRTLMILRLMLGDLRDTLNWKKIVPAHQLSP